MASGSETEKDIVLNYLKDQNRPFSVIDVFNNLHKKVGKTAVGKCLDDLVAEGSVLEKTYGKQKVYTYNQQILPAVNDVELNEMDHIIETMNQSLREENDSCRSMEAELKMLQSSITTEAAQSELQKLTEEIRAKSSKLAALRESAPEISYEEKDRIVAVRAKNLREWRKRKRMANEMLAALSDCCSKSKKELLEDIGIERDEDAGVAIPVD